VSKRSIDAGHNNGGRVVEIGANRQSCDSCTTLLFKLVLEAVAGLSAHERSVVDRF